MANTVKSEVLALLQASTAPMTGLEIGTKLPNAKMSTICRALRALFAQNKATRAGMAGRWMKWTTAMQPPVPPQQTQTSTTFPTPVHPNQESFMQMAEAVEKVVNQFTAKNKTFSAHDVTRALRELVNCGQVKIDSVNDVTTVSNQTVQRIEHNDVRDAVHQLFQDGKISGYDRVNNGQFWEYSPAAGGSTSSPSSSTPPTVPPTNGTGGGYTGASTI